MPKNCGKNIENNNENEKKKREFLKTESEML